LERYRVRKVRGDRYGGAWPADRFQAHRITYEPAEQTKSQLYGELLPVVSSSLVVVRDLAPLMARPFGDVVSAWSPTTFLVSLPQAQQLLSDLRVSAELTDEVLTAIDRILREPTELEGQRPWLGRGREFLGPTAE
jgi:hypothetical protein